MSAAGTASGVEPELEQIAMISAGKVTRMTEGGLSYIHMEGLRFMAHGVEKTMDALLCLNYPNATYPTKLFFPANLGLALNWNGNAFIFGKQWFSWSWKGVSPNQPPIAILAGHLEAFR